MCFLENFKRYAYLWLEPLDHLCMTIAEVNWVENKAGLHAIGFKIKATMLASRK